MFRRFICRQLGCDTRIMDAVLTHADGVPTSLILHCQCARCGHLSRVEAIPAPEMTADTLRELIEIETLERWSRL